MSKKVNKNNKLKKEWAVFYDQAKKSEPAAFRQKVRRESLSEYEHLYNKTFKESLLLHQSQNTSIGIEDLGDLINSAELLAVKKLKEKIKNRFSPSEIMSAVSRVQLEPMDAGDPEGYWASKIVAVIITEMLSQQEIESLKSVFNATQYKEVDRLFFPVMRVPQKSLERLEDFMLQSEKMIIEDSLKHWGNHSNEHRNQQ